MFILLASCHVSKAFDNYELKFYFILLMSCVGNVMSHRTIMNSPLLGYSGFNTDEVFTVYHCYHNILRIVNDQRSVFSLNFV
jgi:hypothetical protein